MTEVQPMAQTDSLHMTAGSGSSASRVLLVEPDAAICSSLQTALEREGFEVERVSTAVEALRELTSSGPSLPAVVLCDVALEGTDAFVLCAQLRGDPRTSSLPFVLLSRKRDDDHLAKAASAGADDYLSAPLLAADVVSRVKLECGARSEDGTLGIHTERLALAELTRALLAGIRTGKVTMKEGRASFSFRRGRVIDARFEGMEGEPALSRMLTLSTGDYAVTFSQGLPRGTSSLGAERFASHVLPKVRRGLQLLDQGIPPGSRLVVNFAALAKALDGLPEDVNRVIRLFDGKRTLKRVVIDCPLDETATLEVIQRLDAMNILQPAEDEPAELSSLRRLSAPFLEPTSPPKEEQLFGDGSPGAGAPEQSPAPGEDGPGPAAEELVAATVESPEVSVPMSAETALFVAQAMEPAPSVVPAETGDVRAAEPAATELPVSVATEPVVEPAPAPVVPEPEPVAEEPASGVVSEPVAAMVPAQEEQPSPVTAPEPGPDAGPEPAAEVGPSDPPDAVTGSQQTAGVVASGETEESVDGLFERFSRGEKLVEEDPPLDEEALAAVMSGQRRAYRILFGTVALGFVVALLLFFRGRAGQHPVESVASSARSPLAEKVSPPQGTAPEPPRPAPPSAPVKEEPKVAAPTREEPKVAVAPAREEPKATLPTKEEPKVAVAPAREEPKATLPAKGGTSAREEPKVTVAKGERVAAPEEAVPSLEDGVKLYDAGKAGEAAKVLSKVVVARPLSTAAWVMLGMARFDAGDSKGAQEAAMKVLTLDPKNGRAMMLMASIYLTRQQRQQAEVQLKKYLALEPNGQFAEEARSLLSRLETKGGKEGTDVRP